MSGEHHKDRAYNEMTNIGRDFGIVAAGFFAMSAVIILGCWLLA